MKKLYCCGDSFTSEDYYSKRYEAGLSTCWPTILKQKLGNNWQVYNGSYCGASNNFIVRDFFNYIAVYGNPDLVCIAWSAATRFSIYNGSNNSTGFTRDWAIDPISHYNHYRGDSKYRKIEPSAVELGKHIVKNNLWLCFMEKAINDWLTHIFVIQSYCESNNIKYIFTQAVNPVTFIETKDNNNYMKHVIDCIIASPLMEFINEEHFINWPAYRSIGGNTLSDLTRKTEMSFGYKDSHPNDKGHKMIAEMYYDNCIRL